MITLRQDSATRAEVVKRLAASYGWMLGKEGVKDLIEQIADLDSGEVSAALEQHVNNTSPGRAGRTVGAYPPQKADLLQYIEETAKSKQREEDKQRYKNKYKEPNLSAIVPEKHRTAWRAEFAKGARRARWRDRELIPFLKRNVGLDFLGNPVDTLAWRQVCGALSESWEEDKDLTFKEAAEIYQEAREKHREKGKI